MYLAVLFGYSVLFGLLAVTICLPAWEKYYIPAKVLNSLGFAAVFFAAAYFSGEVAAFWLMLPAFFCCFIGDILMALYNCYHRRMHFLMGLGIFLAGHICFVRWLAKMQPIRAVDLLFPAAAVFVALGLTGLKGMHTGSMKKAILIYSFFVALFFAKGVHLAVAQFSVSNLMIAGGSTLFFVSDVLILFLYFYKKRKLCVHLLNLGTYYYGMLLLAANLIF